MKNELLEKINKKIEDLLREIDYEVFDLYFEWGEILEEKREFLRKEEKEKLEKITEIKGILKEIRSYLLDVIYLNKQIKRINEKN